MPRACTVCTHAERNAIDRALVEATPKRRIAAQHRLEESAVRRHAEKHLSGVLVLAAEAGEVTRADSLLERARWAHAQAVDVLEQAREANSPAGMLQALDRLVPRITRHELDGAEAPTRMVIEFAKPEAKQGAA